MRRWRSAQHIAGLAPAPEDEPADRHHDETDRGQHADKLVHPAEELPLVPGDPIADNAIYDVPIGKAFARGFRSEEHTSELQSLMRISYAVFCLKKKTNTTHKQTNNDTKPHLI